MSPIIFLLIISLIVGIAGVIRPIPKLKLATRKEAGILLGLSYAALFLLVSNDTKSTLVSLVGIVLFLAGTLSLVIPIKAFGIKNRKMGARIVILALAVVLFGQNVFEGVGGRQEFVWNAEKKKDAIKKAAAEKEKQIETEEKLKTENPEAYAKLLAEREEVAKKAARQKQFELEAAEAEEKQREAAQKRKELEAHPADIKITNWYRGGFDNIFILNAVVTNKADFPIKDISIHCKVFSESNTELDEVAETVYKVIPAGKSISVHDLHMGFVDTQSQHANCQVLDYHEVGK